MRPTHASVAPCVGPRPRLHGRNERMQTLECDFLISWIAGVYVPRAWLQAGVALVIPQNLRGGQWSISTVLLLGSAWEPGDITPFANASPGWVFQRWWGTPTAQLLYWWPPSFPGRATLHRSWTGPSEDGWSTLATPSIGGIVKSSSKPNKSHQRVCAREDLLARNWTGINKSSLDQFRRALRGVWKHLSLSETGQSTHCLQGAPCKLHDHPSANLGTEIPALNPCQWARGPSPKPVQRWGWTAPTHAIPNHTSIRRRAANC